jgi:hydroxypyruvate isomerase
MIFTELPIIERVRRIDDLGFQVEIWDWTRYDVDDLQATGAQFSSMTGYVKATSSIRMGRGATYDSRAVDPCSGPARYPSTQPAWRGLRQ